MTIMPGMGPNMGKPAGGLFGMFQQASPLLMAMGQNMATAPQQRDPMAMQRGMMQMMQMQEQQKAQAQQEQQRAAVARVLQSGQVPQGLAGILGAMEPQQAAGTLAQVMMGGVERNPYERYRVVGNQLVDMGAEGGPAPVLSAPEEMPDGLRTLQMRAMAAGFDPGTPEFQQFIKHGGSTPDAFRPATPEEAAAVGATAGQVNERTGEVKPSQNRDAPAEGERKALGFFNRMSAAERIIGELSAEGVNAPSLTERGLDMVLPEDWALSGNSLRLRQAQRDWVRSKLRFESGAVIGDEEADQEIKTYFPLPNDPPEVIQQKADARQIAMAAMREAAGRALPQSGGQPGQPSQPAAPGPFNIPSQVQEAVRTAPEGSVIEGPGGVRFVVRGGQLVRE